MTDAVQPRVVVKDLCGWGRYPVLRGCEVVGEDFERITRGAALSRGLGRSYGDASLPASEHDVVASSPLADRLLAFDSATGVLRAEAGLSLLRLNRVFLPRGWFTPVSPGTQYVTLGGMVAADVHGKNHHRAGCFGAHVTQLKMRVADGRVLECSDTHEQELFRATLGGMGLTGHILEVEFRMQKISSPWIWSESERVADLEGLIERLKSAGERWPYTACWVDCLRSDKRMGRGILFKGRWAAPHEVPVWSPPPRSAVAVPFLFPNWALSAAAVRAFNSFQYHKHGSRVHRGVVHPEAFFYPLDIVLEWNRLYGRRGFTQYQCVLPLTAERSSPRRFLELLNRRGGTVFLCVMKDCGAEGKGLLSFPKPGISFAIDLPVHPHTPQLIDALNDMVIAEGGRVYLAKDAFTRAEHFHVMEPRLAIWNQVRTQWDPQHNLRSAQSVRVLGDTP